jgi:hypothetical protein
MAYVLIQSQNLGQVPDKLSKAAYRCIMQSATQNFIEYYTLMHCGNSYQLTPTDFNQTGSPRPHISIIAR